MNGRKPIGLYDPRIKSRREADLIADMEEAAKRRRGRSCAATAGLALVAYLIGVGRGSTRTLKANAVRHGRAT